MPDDGFAVIVELQRSSSNNGKLRHVAAYASERAQPEIIFE
jgi:hypothetical protein